MNEPLQNTLDNFISLVAREVAKKCVQEIGRWMEQEQRAANVRATHTARANVDAKNMLKLGEVQKRVALSRSAIYLMMKTGEFPRSVKIGKRAVAWPEASIMDWMARRSSVESL